MKRRHALLLSITVVLALCAACGLWLHRERRQYALNRQLIVRLTNGDTTRALILVNAGADPNTRYKPSPAPTLHLLLVRVLHHQSMPVNKTSTALMIGCGSTRITDDLVAGKISVGFSENVVLIRAMLAHGANVNAKDFDEHTALSDAAKCGRLHTMELLLQHGANANFQDAEGTSVLSAVLLASQDRSLLTELLAYGADPSWRDKSGLTPVGVAYMMKRPDFVRLLQQHGAK